MPSLAVIVLCTTGSPRKLSFHDQRIVGDVFIVSHDFVSELSMYGAFAVLVSVLIASYNFTFFFGSENVIKKRY